MSSLLSAELAATCSSIGYFEPHSKKYYADENTLETVKDLIRYLRRDRLNHEIRRQLGETKVLQTDLLPLLKNYWQQTELFDVLLRLIVNLTSPPLILYNEEVPTDKMGRKHFMQIQEHLQCYKEAFADEAIWAILSTRFSKILEIDPAERGDENCLIIERILILIRNILYVPPDPTTERRTDNDATVHDQVLWSLHQSGMLDIILYVSSSPNEQAYYMHTLEILSHLLREQNASDLAKAELERNTSEKQRDESELLTIRQKEALKKQQKAKVYTSARHSRFGGTFVARDLKAVGDNDLIFRKPLSKFAELNFDTDKARPKVPKNRAALRGDTTERRSAFSVRLFLREFCIEFLNGAYNALMHHVRATLARQKSQNHDESYYFWAIRFFMEFNRSYHFEVKLVSETTSIQTFHYVQQNMENYFDMMQTDKTKLRQWSRRLHVALLAYRELLLSLCHMDRSPDGDVRDSSKVIKSNVFYVLEYRELVLTLLVTFDERKMSDLYLRDLIETQHVFLKLFESFCRSGSVIVQKKKTKKRAKKVVAAQPVEIDWEQRWDEISTQVSTLLENGDTIPTDIAPFDATLDIPIDEQKSEAMLNIQRKLRHGDLENAIGMLRAAREVWPENDSFGNADMSPEEEYVAIREIFMADLGENTPEVTEQPIYNENDEEEGSEEEGVDYSETDFNFEDFVKRLAHPKILRACRMALSKFEENSSHANHCIVKLLHRIAFDCKMYVMLFQISYFITFRKIFAMKQITAYKELVRFATFIIRKFLELAKENKMVFIEALFWTSSKDSFDIEHGYGSYQQQSKGMARVWTEQDEDELRRLFMEHEEKQLKDDVVDWIVANLIDNTRSRRAVLKKLKEMYLLADSKGSKSSRVPKTWGPDEEEQLQELYEKFKDAMDPLGLIVDHLTVKRPKNRIIEKLLVMGLISDRKEVRKKRAKGAKSKSHGSMNARNSESENSIASEDDDQSDNERTIQRANPSKMAKKKMANISRHDVAKSALGVISLGLVDALEWLKESLADAVEDWEETDEEGVPLVPIMEFSIEALENDDFKSLLKSMGLKEPIDDQGSYWTIPASLNLESIKISIDVLGRAIEGTLTIPEKNEIIEEQNQEKSDSSEEEDVFEKIRKIGEQNQIQEDAKTVNQTLKSTQSSKKTKKRRVIIDSDEDVEENNQLENLPIDVEENGTRRIISDDDEDNVNTKVKNKSKSKVTFFDSDDSESESTKTELNQSPNQDEEEAPPKKQPKPRRRFIDYESEDSTDNDNALERAEELLKKQKKTKSKKSKVTDKKKNIDKAPKSKKEKTNEIAQPKKVIFKSKEYITTDDDSSGEESRLNNERLLREELKKVLLLEKENESPDDEILSNKKQSMRRKVITSSDSEDKENSLSNNEAIGEKRSRETDSESEKMKKKNKCTEEDN